MPSHTYTVYVKIFLKLISVPFHRNVLKCVVKDAKTGSEAEEEGMVVKTRVRDGVNSSRRRKGKKRQQEDRRQRSRRQQEDQFRLGF